jgi:hypothetical protein
MHILNNKAKGVDIMDTVTTKAQRDTLLRTKNRFYQCGWLDAERGEPAQASTSTDLQTEFYYHDYLLGYADACELSYWQEEVMA